MELIIKNKIISEEIYDIIKKVKSKITNGKLKDIVDKKDNLLVTCPFHKNGFENHPSCHLYCSHDSNLRPGEFHCFTCGESGSIEKFIAKCFDSDIKFAEEWLEENFSSDIIEKKKILPKIEKLPDKKYLDQKIIDDYKYFHPYMFKRKLSEDIIRKFSIGYDEKTDCIVFPVWDENNNLVMLTRRSVNNKSFYIDKDAEKPVYLLNFIKKENLKEIYIVESQINALTCWTYGYPAVALFGTGTKKQYDILNKSGIRHMILCLDGDAAGDNGILKLIYNLSKNIIVDVKIMKKGFDVNDLTKEEFEKLPIINSYDWLKMYSN